jgi:hypothetical protein
VRLPGAHEKVWLLGDKGEAEERAVRPAAWLNDLDLMDNEVDVTGLLNSTSFAPGYVVAPSFMGKPWVERVPDGVAMAHDSEPSRGFPAASARELVSRLLVDYAPAERKVDARWKKCLAAFLRTVHR